MTDKPAPLIYVERGKAPRILDQSELIPPKEAFSMKEYRLFWDTDVQRAVDSIQAGDLQLAFPFWDENQLVAVAGSIMDLAWEDVVEIAGVHGTYSWSLTCGPEVELRLGQKVRTTLPTGKQIEGYVNSLVYNYQDSSQFTLTVTLGPKWLPSIFGNGWGDSTNQMKVTNVTKSGVVLAAGLNNIEFIVWVEGFGSMACYNTAGPDTIIRNGDNVKVTVYNVPIGEN